MPLKDRPRSARYACYQIALTLGLWTGFGSIGCTSASAALPLAAQAAAGNPLGAGRVSVMLSTDDELLAAATGALRVTDEEGRILYPVVANRDGLRLLERLTGGEGFGGPERFEVYFLFTGDAPLNLRVTAATEQTTNVTPATGPRLHRNMLTRWWREYRRTMKEQSDQGDYPPIVENYLTHQLGHRLGMRLAPVRIKEPSTDPGRQLWELLTGAEILEQAILTEVVTGTSPVEPASLPLPDPVRWQHEEQLPPGDELRDVAIEAMAEQVPGDCFYVRFGKFSNYLWFGDLTEEAGGDIGRMVTLRGVQFDASSTIQQQLAIEDLPFADVLGDRVIADMALIGRDPLIGQGAAIGVLLQEAAPVVETGLVQLRTAIAAREAERGCRLEQVPIGEYEVSLLSTRDNSIRSFYAKRGPFHLITNCEAIVDAFLRIPQTQRSIARDTDFLAARHTFPLDRNDIVFAFFPRAFFAGLATPQYQIELSRRVRSIAEIRVLQMARQAYVTESRAGWLPHPGGPDALQPENVTMAMLVDAGLVPPTFGRRVDGSRLEPAGEQVLDSLRGGLGYFLPVPDVPVVSATAQELERYRAVGELSASGWDAWDPVTIAIQRRIDNGQAGREHLEFVVRVAPFERAKYDRWLSLLGEPTTEYTVPDPQDILTIEAVLRGGRLLPGVGDHHLLFCLRDTESLPPLPAGQLLGKLQMARLAPAYIAAWPELGLLRLIPLQGLARDLGNGYAELPLGLLRRERDGFVTLSFHPDLLERNLPEIAQAAAPAQLRVTLGDISATGLTEWINAATSDRALRASLGNVRLLHLVQQQLGVEASEARSFAEALVGGRLTCALGGQYVHTADGDGAEGEQAAGQAASAARWKSTAWSSRWPLQLNSPEAYQAPIVQWLRGLELRIALRSDRAEVDGKITIQRQQAADNQGGRAPLFQWFGTGRE